MARPAFRRGEGLGTHRGRLFDLTVGDLQATLPEVCSGSISFSTERNEASYRPNPAKSQAVSQDLPIILGAQLGRGAGSDTKVRLENLRESGDIEQDANLVLGLYNESVDRIQELGQEDVAKTVPLQISVLKNRQGAQGLSSSLTFHRPRLRLTDNSKGTW